MNKDVLRLALAAMCFTSVASAQSYSCKYLAKISAEEETLVNCASWVDGEPRFSRAYLGLRCLLMAFTSCISVLLSGQVVGAITYLTIAVRRCLCCRLIMAAMNLLKDWCVLASRVRSVL